VKRDISPRDIICQVLDRLTEFVTQDGGAKDAPGDEPGAGGEQNGLERNGVATAYVGLGDGYGMSVAGAGAGVKGTARKLMSAAAAG
jgi:hypothetical protein